MRSFFKMLFASCLGTVIGMIALFVIGAFFLVGAVSAIGLKDKVDVAKNSVLKPSPITIYPRRIGVAKNV